MKRFLAILLMSGCSSVFIEAPPSPPDLDRCPRLTREIRTSAPGFFLPLPFKGSNSTVIYATPPKNWEFFNGSVYLTDVEWDIDWISYAAISVDLITIAVYDDGEWRAHPNVDLFPHLIIRDGDLTLEASLKGKGHLPEPDAIILAEAEVALCGENANMVHD